MTPPSPIQRSGKAQRDHTPRVVATFDCPETPLAGRACSDLLSEDGMLFVLGDDEVRQCKRGAVPEAENTGSQSSVRQWRLWPRQNRVPG